jgi:predicted small integral membrane protein
VSALRLSRIALVTAVAFFFTLVAFGNITDYGANWKFVTHVMSMDTTFRDPDLMWRAVTDPKLQHAANGTIITGQALTALVL